MTSAGYFQCPSANGAPQNGAEQGKGGALAPHIQHDQLAHLIKMRCHPPINDGVADPISPWRDLRGFGLSGALASVFVH